MTGPTQEGRPAVPWKYGPKWNSARYSDGVTVKSIQTS
jgi:hypothetical protein